MRYILIIIIAISLIGCSQPIIAETIPIAPETVIVYDTIIETKYIEVIDNTKINELELELDSYKSLISQLNELLKCVYYIECTNNIGGIGNGTAFSIKYNDKIYVISAGHLVDNEHGIFSNFKINGIHLELLDYKVTDYLPDYAIFYSDKITTGLDYDLIETEPDYRLGYKELIQENNNWGEQGSCGSPIINTDGEVTAIHVGYMQDIDEVLQAIK